MASKWSVTERGGPIADPFPKLNRSTQMGPIDKPGVVERLGVETDGTDQKGATGTRVAVEQISQWRTPVAGDTRCHTVEGEAHGWMGDARFVDALADGRITIQGPTELTRRIPGWFGQHPILAEVARGG